jgi:hypothetical protein
MHRVLEKIGFKTYRPQLVQCFFDDDHLAREQFSSTFLSRLTDEPDLVDRIVRCDEASLKLNGMVNHHNCTYWSDSNPNRIMSTDLNQLRETVWAGISSSGIIGPVFFEGIVNSERYALHLFEDIL